MHVVDIPRVLDRKSCTENFGKKCDRGSLWSRVLLVQTCVVEAMSKRVVDVPVVSDGSERRIGHKWLHRLHRWSVRVTVNVLYNTPQL